MCIFALKNTLEQNKRNHKQIIQIHYIMKAKTILCALVASMLFIVACDEKEETPALADNVLVYDGVTYNGQSAATVFPNGDQGFIQFVLESSTEGQMFSLQGGLYQDAHNRTFDLTKHLSDITFNFHLNVGDDLLDVQYSNNPDNLWGFLNGDNMAGASCFKSGTATCTVNGNHLVVEVDGTLKNDKPLKFKIATECHDSM